MHPKNVEMGNRPLFKSKNVLIEYDDAKSIAEGEKITLMKWGNIKITGKK